MISCNGESKKEISKENPSTNDFFQLEIQTRKNSLAHPDVVCGPVGVDRDTTDHLNVLRLALTLVHCVENKHSQE